MAPVPWELVDMGGVGRGNLAASASVILWATTFPATERLLATWHPLPLAGARILTGGLALMLLSLALGRLPRLRQVRWRDVLLVGSVGFGLGPGLIVLGQALSGQVMVAILVTMTPLVAALFALVGGDEALSGRRALGLGLVLAGGAIAVVAGGTRSMDLRGGEAIVLLSIVCWVWGTRAATSRLAHLDDLTRSAVCLFVGGTIISVVAVLAIAAGVVSQPPTLDGVSLGLIAWIGVVAVGFSSFAWFVAARLVGMTVAAIHQNLTPFYVMVMAVLLGGQVRSLQIVGSLLVVAGALLAQLPPDWTTRLKGRRIRRRAPT